MVTESGSKGFWWLFQAVVVAIVLSAILHTAASSRFTENKDVGFVVCLLVNSLLLIRVVRSAHEVLVEKYKLYTSRDIFDVKWMIVFGFGYGGAFGLAPFIIPFEPNETLLKGTAALFLFSHNFLTGLCVWALIRFYRLVLRYKDSLDIDLWDRSSSAYKGHLRVFEMLIISISLICAVAVVAALSSCFRLGIFLHVFAAVCCCFMLSAYLVPRYPLIVKLREKKNSRLEEIDAMIEAEYTAQIEKAKDGGIAEVEGLEKLKELRKIVSETGVNCFTAEKKARKIVGTIFMPIIPTAIKFVSTQIPMLIKYVQTAIR